jgi:hypothetical protein
VAGDAESPVERLLAKDRDEQQSGRALSDRARHTQRTLEAYLKAGNRPRWMERIAEIDRGIATERRRLERAYRALREACAGQPEAFAERWLEIARSWRFDALNELIHQHNEWYPIERQLPIDLRTRDYIKVGGRSYRRPVLTPEWVLGQFPAVLP